MQKSLVSSLVSDTRTGFPWLLQKVTDTPEFNLLSEAKLSSLLAVPALENSTLIGFILLGSASNGKKPAPDEVAVGQHPGWHPC